MSAKFLTCHQRHRLMIEAASFGLAYGAGLWWATVCLLASFRPNELSAPYWSELPSLRADTSGIIAFFAVAIFLSTSEFLRIRRRQFIILTPGESPTVGLMSTAALAISRAIGLLATGLVIYLSLNTVTHPATLDMQATHLALWPTEGTLRVTALLLCVFCATILRFLNAEQRR